MATIQPLPDLLVNKIAAGEVIERPASVVKELLENALDAGATRISLTIEDGGKKLIRVTDNGSGIAADQLDLAVMPHATSKISSEEDLFRIHTMGFRGEALASIGSVAHLNIKSRASQAEEGAEIHVAGEEIQSRTAVGCPVGTTVEIRDLFFNVPARRKFLRGANTESGHVQEQFARVALPNPQVEFELFNGSRRVKHLPRCEDMRERISAFHGTEIAQDLIRIERDERGLRIVGYAAKPAQNRASGKWQYVFLNGRYIRDRYVQHAVKEAYRGLMEHDRFPVVFLSLGIDPEQVDINVHPTKIEVRWQDSNMIHSQVLSALRETFLQHDLTPALSARRAVAPLTSEQRLEERQRIADFFKQATPASAGDAPSRIGSEMPRQTASVSMADLAMRFQDGSDAERAAAGEEASGFRLQATGASPEARSPEPGACRPSPAPVLQLHKTYLVTETDEGMLIIDQHALHERIIYDQLQRRIASGTLEAQRLLIPETIEMTSEHVSVLQDHHALLQKLGIDFTLYGETTVAVQSFPSVLHNSAITPFVKDLADRLAEKGNKPHTEVLIHEVLDMMACKAAVKAGDPLTDEEMRGLIQQRDVVDKSSNCPHGRPTTLRFSLADLERQFKRT
ncbi:MAG: DNA mismatch repair endonuclease MutL [Planctomycetota bacterium]|nr:DNA mismatch repair endonuclease MutL [Planctomycetota bacterium]